MSCSWAAIVVQMPPWAASAAQVAALEQLLREKAWPATLAGSVSCEGYLTLPNSADLSLANLLLLKPTVWLNDEFVNYGMWWLQQRDTHMFGTLAPPLVGVWDGVQGVSCHFFSSFFMSKLYLDAGVFNYSNVGRWTAALRLRLAAQAKHEQGVLSCSLIVAPCNLNNVHWVLVVADLDRCRILYLDPMGVSLQESYGCGSRAYDRLYAT
jgi:Ulp1 family protease